MKLSKKSWHYRLMIWAQFEFPNNLCTYFWKVIVVIFCVPFFYVCDGSIRRSTLILFLSILGMSVSIYESRGQAVFIIPSIYAAILLGLCLFVINDKWREQHPSIQGGSREPSLVVEYLRAKKRKVCPIITWDDS